MHRFLLLSSLLLTLSACALTGSGAAHITPTAASPVPANTATLPPVLLTPLHSIAEEPPVGTPYPTAGAIHGDVIAFIADGGKGFYSYTLWVANVDGSGQKRLVENIDNSQGPPPRNKDYMSLGWSPDGKWISYDANDALWLVSPDGSIVRRFLSLPDKSKGNLFSWSWSPDGSRIAYAQTPSEDANPRHASIGVVDVPSGQVHSLLDYDFGYSVSLSWTPDGHSLWLSSAANFLALVDSGSGRILKEAPQARYPCQTGFFDWQVWSPNGQWFVLTEHGVGSAGSWFHVCAVDGRSVLPAAQVHVNSPASIHWDPTGNAAYFVADRRLDQSMSPGIEQELMRLDARTGKVERLLTLETDPKGNIDFAHWCSWEVSISPDGHTVEAHCRLGSNKPSFVILDLQRFSTRPYDVDLTLDGWIWRYTVSDWSSDSQNIVVMAKAPLPPGDVSIPFSEYDAFYALNIHTGTPVLVSGWHKGINEWAVSPAPINP